MMLAIVALAVNLAFDVPREGGVYTVPVHPDVVTVLYFPCEVRDAFASSPRDFQVEKSGNAITVRPKVGVEVGNLSVSSNCLRVGVTLDVAASAALAAINVAFRAQEDLEEFERRVEEELERRLAAQMAPLVEREKNIEREARRHIAEALRKRLAVVELNAWGRNDHVILGVHRMIWVGNDVCFDFSVQNRTGRPFRLEGVAATLAAQRWNADVAFSPRTVAPGTHKRGTACLPSMFTWQGHRLRLTLREKATQDAPTRAPFVHVRLRL